MSFVHKDFITTFLSLKFFDFFLAFRGNVYKKVYKGAVMNKIMNKMLAVCYLFTTIGKGEYMTGIL
jgi:hypothetical protein